MPLKKYGVLKGKASDSRLASPGKEHYQIRIDALGASHRIAINAKSQLNPPDVLFYMHEDFHHSIVQEILDQNLQDGFTPLASTPTGIALDFIRRNLFPIEAMKPLPYNKPGADNDLNEKLDFYVKKAIHDGGVLFAFGEKWGPEPGVRDQYFGFDPGNGIHDIHMNQGNTGSFKKDNGVYQDGGLLINFPAQRKWVAIFIAFQSQAWHTDDTTGHPLNTVPIHDDTQPEFATPIRIIAAMVNPRFDDVGKEYVLLLNKSDVALNLKGWKIMDKSKTRFDMINDLTIPGGDTLKVPLSGRDAQLANNGGIITLLNKDGLKVDGVSYTNKQASVAGELVVF